MISPDEWGALQVPKISGRRVRQLCEQGRVSGAVSHGHGNRTLWEIPEAAIRRSPGVVFKPVTPKRLKLPMKRELINGISWETGPWKPKHEGFEYYQGNPFASAFKPDNPKYREWDDGYREAMLGDRG
jgi:hypothetical protein